MQLRLHMKCKLMDSWSDVIFLFYQIYKTVNQTSTPLPPSLLHYSLHLSNITVIMINPQQIHSSTASKLFDLNTFNSWILHINSDAHPFKFYINNDLQHVEIGWSIGRRRRLRTKFHLDTLQ